MQPHPPSIAGSWFLHLVFVLSVIQGSQKWLTLPTTTMAAFDSLAGGDGLLRLSYLKSSQSPILSFNTISNRSSYSCTLRRSTLLQFIFFPNLNSACLAQANAAHRQAVQRSFVCHSLYSRTIACLWPWPELRQSAALITL
jgi:hypothetical protein